MWTPLFPRYLDTPGMWDEAHYYHLKWYPTYTVSFYVDGRFITPKFHDLRWDYNLLTKEYNICGYKLMERSAVLPYDTLYSEYLLKGDKPIDGIAWFALPSKELQDIQIAEHAIFLIRKLDGHLIHTGFMVSPQAQSFMVQGTNPVDMVPIPEVTPFYEVFDGKLPNTIHTNGYVIFIGLHFRLIPNKPTGVGLIFADSGCELIATHQYLRKTSTPIHDALKDWQNFLSKVPKLETSLDKIQKYYYYRWYGLYTFAIWKKRGNYHYPAVAEGPAYFRVPIAYSAPAHVRETMWMQDDLLARGELLEFLSNQLADGSLPGRIHLDRCVSFYHGDWGRSLRYLLELHPNIEFAHTAYEGFKRYVEYFDKIRDPEGMGLYDIIDHFETGQEFNPRYTWVREDADMAKPIRLKGVDVTVYIYSLKQVLAWLADKLGKHDEATKWTKGALKIKHALLDYCWDTKDKFFYDYDPIKKEKVRVKTITGFYPFYTDIVSDQHMGALNHLFNPDEFWSTYPVRTLSKDDPHYSALGYWKGERMNCPWNGRVWPMTNSHIADVLIRLSKLDHKFKAKAREFILKFVEMMFFPDGTPNCYEHYHPDTGTPSLFRGVNDYQHSWVIDLIMRGLMGLQVEAGNITVDTNLPSDAYMRVENIPTPKGLLSLEYDRGRLSQQLKDF